MPRYRYKAKNINNKVQYGRMQAANENEAYQKLSVSGYYPVYLRQEQELSRGKTLKSKYLADFSRQLGTLIKSGIPLLQAMEIIKKYEANGVMFRYYENIYFQLLQGGLLSDALEGQQDAFPPIMINMLKAGESGGGLAASALKMADYYEKDNRLQQKIKGALIYPIFLMALTAVSLLLVFTVVLPNFFDLFASVSNLPLSTRVLIWVSSNLRNHFISFTCMAIFFIIAAVFLFQRPSVLLWTDKVKIYFPVIGKLLKIIYTARFSRSVGSLYSNGVPLVQCLKISKGVVGNSYIEKQFTSLIADICNGIPISEAVAKVQGFDRKLAANIYIGEETGSLDMMLENIADSFDYEADQASQRLTALVEPVMIVIMAVAIGFIMMSVMVPIYQYYQSIG